MGKSIGIDLGTTNSSMAIVKRSIDIIRNKEENELTKSCVAWYNNGLVVGQEVHDYVMQQDPINAIVSVKRLMGNSIDSENVQKMIAKKDFYKYGIVPKSLGTKDTLAILINGKEFLPEEISAEILKKLKSDAEEKLNDQVTHAVITVPAYFTEKQKYATLVAAKLAGLKVQKLLPEPTAAAIAHGVDNLDSKEAKTILVFDFGGGTFDISIISAADGQYLEIAKGGNMWLGGDDIDSLLIQYIKEKTQKEYNINSLDSLINKLPEKKKFKVEYELKKRSEELKKRLSSVDSSIFELNDLIQDENQDILEIEYPITRSEFNIIINPIVEDTIRITKDLLRSINYEIEMIDEVILVGGSSKIPLVRKRMKDIFADRVKVSAEPMLDITKGAAIVSQRLGAEDLTSEISTEEIRNKYNFDEISHSISHDVYVITGEEENEKSELVFQTTEPLPAQKNLLLRTMYPNQRIAKFIISTHVSDEKPENSICFLNLEKNYPEDSKLYCTLNMDENEIINVSLQFEGVGEKVSYQLSRGGAGTKANLTIDETIGTINSMNLSPRQINQATELLQKEIDNIMSLDPDGSKNDQRFWKIIYDVGELPNKIKNTELFEDVSQRAQRLLNYIEWVIDNYSRYLSPTSLDDLRSLRFKLKNSMSEISQSEYDEINESFNLIIEKEPLVDNLLYIRYAQFVSEDHSKRDQLATYHNKIIDAVNVENTEQANQYLTQSFKVANEILKSHGQLDKIKTAVRL